MKKLNLGSGQKYLRGYINIDKDPAWSKNPDVVCDAMEIDKHFDPGTIDEIFSSHFIEHHWLTDIKRLFAKCFTLLKPGGRMIHEGPDAVKMAHALAAGTITEDYFFTHLYGDEEKRLEFGQQHMHVIPLHGKLLVQLAEEAGFVNIKLSAGKDHRQPHRDLRIEAEKP